MGPAGEKLGKMLLASIGFIFYPNIIRRTMQGLG